MSKSIRSRVIPCLCALALFSGIAPSTSAAPPDAQAKRSPVLAALQAEMERSMKTLSTLDPPAYYMGYTVTETQRVDVSGSNGALLNSNETRNRWLEVSVRTGSYALDNSHKVGERQQQSGGPGAPVPIDDDAEVLRRTIWLETDKQYRAASEALIKIKTGKEVKVGGASPRVYQGVSRIAGDHQFHRDVRGAGAKRVSGNQRKDATAIRTDSLPAGAVHPRQGAGRNGHRPLLQF